MQISKKPYFIERLLSVATYLSTGLVGFVWLIIAAIFKKQIRSFLMYHIMQSIFLSFSFYILSILANLIEEIIKKIPLINLIPVLLNNPIPLFFDLSIIQILTTSLLLYLVITAGLGYYSYLPWVSDIISGNTGKK